MINAIKRAFFTARFKKANEHYKNERVLGERASIAREGAEPVEAIFYYPKTRENMPVFVQIHGGAWVGLDAVDDDRYCARLSGELDAFVVNVNYKRLYEKPFPYQLEEVVSVVEWLKNNAAELGVDPDKIVISGGSAGGHITAGAAVRLAQKGVKIAGQIMEVPFLDFTAFDKMEVGSLIKLMLDIYPSQIPLDCELISPGASLTDETAGKLAPASVIVCGRDPLCEQGERYAERLKKAGRLLDLRKYETGYHGFGTDKAEEKPEQDRLREDCFKYKVEMTRRMFAGENG
ncbi:MAG: alpha/beta hydrolase [Oscillospiraceae bacterium]|nr:alpha/beta hydrolase [Oscillospiraceae bacterium]